MLTPRRHSRRELLRLGAGALLGGAFLAACGDSDGSVLSGEPKAPSQRRSGELRIGLGALSSPVGLPGLVYSNLVAFDPREGHVYGDLANRVEFVDPLTVSFGLREGLSFHTNAGDQAVPLTVEDIQHDFLERAAAGEYLFSQAVEGIDTPDARTVVLRMHAPFSMLFDYLADPVLGGVRSTARYGAVDVPVGSGPFIPEGDDAGVAFVASPAFHRSGQPLLERLLIAPGSNDLDAAFASGDLDVRVYPRDVRPDGNARSDSTLLRRTSRRLRGLGLSLLPQKGGGSGSLRHVAAFQDVRVRRAASLALDREALAAVDNSVVAGPVGPAHGPDALSEDDLLSHSLYNHNVAEARKLIDAAGVGEVSFSIEGPNTPPLSATADLVERQLREAGFAPRVNLLPVQDWEPLFLAGDFEVALFELDDLRTPDLGLRLHMSGGLTGSFSLWGYSDPVYDAAAREAFTQMDPEPRAERSREAQRILLDQVPAMFPLCAPPDYASIAHSVRGYEFDAFELNEGWLASRWRIAEPGDD